MYSGTTKKRGYLKTGLHSLVFKGVNLTKDEIKERFNVELDKEPDYNIKTDNFGNDVIRSVVYLAGSNGEMYRMNLNIGDSANKAKSGNYEIITSTGSIVWAGKKIGDEVQIKSEFENHKPLNIGEGDWITFVQRLVSFDSRSGANFYDEMTEFGQTSENIFKDKLQNINNSDLIGRTIIILLAVRQTEDKSYQEVVTNRKTWFSGTEVTDWHINRLKETQEKETVGGNTLCKNLFTYEPMNFNKDLCFNNVPSTPTNTNTNTNTNKWNE